MKPRHLILGVALITAGALVAFGDNTPEPDVVEPVAQRVHPLPPVARTEQAAQQGREPAINLLLSRETLIGDGVGDFASASSQPFAHQDWTPPPPPPPPPPAPVAPPPPMAPPLPFSFLGKSLSEATWEVYLARGDSVYTVKEKTVIDGTYRVDAIAPPMLTLTYLPLNQVQQLNIGVFD